MNKQKKTFTSLDIAAMVRSLQRKLTGLRLSNIYDIDARTFILKFQRGDKKECVVIENGVRIHTTDQPLAKKSMPTGFTMRFRKHVKGKSLESITQIGVERVIDLKFGSENGFHILLEFYAQGNIILTDKDYKIIQCIRSHKYTEEIQTANGQIYPFELAANMTFDSFDLSKEKFETLMESSNEPINPKMIKKFNKSQGKKIKDVLFKAIPCFSPQQIDHFLMQKNLNPNDKSVDIQLLQATANHAIDFFKSFMTKEAHEGFLLPIKKSEYEKTHIIQANEANEEKEVKEGESKVQELPLIDFSPLLLEQHDASIAIKFSDYDQAIDQYYQKLQSQQIKVQTENKRMKALQNVKLDQERRLKKLQEEKDEFVFKAQIIEGNLQDVEAIIQILNILLQSGQDWNNISSQISESRKQGDPLANLIQKVNWANNEVIVLLENPDDVNGDLIPISINYNLNGFENVNLYYKQVKKHNEKESKTQQALNSYIKQSKNLKQEIQIQQNKKMDVINARKQFWFEKFYWFITSENYLVLSGRDQQQNELLVKKYMRKDDIYMHADYHGAASTIVRNHKPEHQVPRASLDEAANFALCRSKAWDAKIISNVWWVYASQVSKSAPTGEYLPTGSFMIRGKKNFLYPSRMEMGLTLLFRLDESCLVRHQNERRPKEEMLEKMEQVDLSEVQVINMEGKGAVIKNDFNQKNQKGNQNQNQNNKNQEQKGQKKSKAEVKKEKKQNQKNKQKEENQIEDQNKPQVKRGQKKKMQKMKKYQEQDEEEQMLKLQLIGSKKTKIQLLKEQESKKQQDQQEQLEAQKKEEEEKAQKEEVSEDSENEISSEENEEKEEIQPKESLENQGKLDKKEEKNDDEDMDSDDSEKGKDPQIKEKEPKEEEEEEIPEDQQVENQQDWLTGNPHQDDQYFFCVLMCAPYNSMQQNYKYKVKLTPGILKKGKAVKQAFYLFQQQQDSNQTEKKMMRSLPDNELVANMIGNVKVSGAGLQKLKDKEKQEKKALKKQLQKANA